MDATWNSLVADLVSLVAQRNEGSRIRVFYAGGGIDTFESLAAVVSDAKFDARLFESLEDFKMVRGLYAGFLGAR